jgi:hypothetical protein
MLKLLVAFKVRCVPVVAFKCGVRNCRFQEDKMIDVCGSQRLLDLLKVSLCNMLQQGYDGAYCGVP